MGEEIKLKHPFLTLVIFIFTFFLISSRNFKLLPIGRPAGAMTGAVLMVLVGVINPEEAYNLVNWDTIALLLGMMIIVEYLRDGLFFEIVTNYFENVLSPKKLLFYISFISAFLSAFLVNDTICVVMTPLVLLICERKHLDPFPFLMSVTTSSNIGSILTLVGNPQNMIIGTLSKISFSNYMLLMSLTTIVIFLLNYLFLLIYYRKRLCSSNINDFIANKKHNELSTYSLESAFIVDQEKIKHKQARLRYVFAGIFFTLIGFFSGFSMAFSALAGATFIILFHGKEPQKIFKRIEWSLLLFFASLFVVIGCLKESGIAEYITQKALSLLQGNIIQKTWLFILFTLIGSNLFSNVPYVLLVADTVANLDPPKYFWCLLAFSSTLAGNLTLVGSVANLIVAELAKDRCVIGFKDYAYYGVPTTILFLIIGTIVFYLFYFYINTLS